jgi:hypothetical protein
VPTSFVQNDGNGEYVLVLQSDGSTKRVDVETGAIQADLVVVTGDLKEGEALTTPDGGN